MATPEELGGRPPCAGQGGVDGGKCRHVKGEGETGPSIYPFDSRSAMVRWWWCDSSSPAPCRSGNKSGRRTEIKDGFAEGKDLVVSVMSAMGEEQICALKDIGPK